MDVLREQDSQVKFAETNPNPVLSSGVDGVLHFVNPAALQLSQDLALGSVEDLLPEDHKDLVKSCLETGTRIVREYKAGDRTLVWSYQSVADRDEIYIYGHDISNYQSSIADAMDLPRANPSPVLISGADGDLHFINPAASQLLQDLGLEHVADVLPRNHRNLVDACLQTSVFSTEEHEVGERNLVWLYRPSNDSDEVYIYGHDISDYQTDTSSAMDFPTANPSPVLTFGADGEFHFINPATSQLLQDLGLEDVADILPRNHKKLADACLKTSTPLTEERKVGGRSLVWLYRSIADSDEVYIYGHDISGCDPKTFCIEGFPKANPNPIFSAAADCMPRFMNHATLQLLQDLGLENTEDMLPRNHEELVRTCLETSAPLIRERKVGGRTIIWSYYPIDDSDLIYVYGHDITNYHPNIF